MKTTRGIKAIVACLFSFAVLSFGIYAMNDMKKNDDTHIKIGETEITVTVDSSVYSIMQSPLISVLTAPIYSTFTDEYAETPLEINASKNNIYEGIISTEIDPSYSFLKITDGNRLYFLGIVIVQDENLNLNLTALTDKKSGTTELVIADDNPKDTFDKIPSGKLCKALLTTGCVPTEAYDDWRKVRKFEEDMWLSILEKGEYSDETEDWVINDLKMLFSAYNTLYYSRRAELSNHIKVDEPPLEAYTFLNTIDYSPVMLRQYPYFNPLGDFLLGILRVQAFGIESIGETGIDEWKSDICKKLSNIIDRPTPLLLNLLSGASYMQQIVLDQIPLSPRQIENIRRGYTDDLGKIILAANDKLVANSKKQLYDDRTGETIDLEEYINDRFPGKPVVVDHWETGCSPCLEAISNVIGKGYHEKYPEVVSLYVCSESSKEHLLQKRIPKIPGEHLKLSETNARDIRYEKGPFEGIPAYTFYDKDHKVVDQMTGFPGFERYDNLLEKISKKQ